MYENENGNRESSYEKNMRITIKSERQFVSKNHDFFRCLNLSKMSVFRWTSENVMTVTPYAEALNSSAYTDLPVLVTEQDKISASTVRHAEALKEAGKKACQSAGMLVRTVESTLEWGMDGQQTACT